MRNGFAASFPLFGTYMFKGMGYQWAGTLLAALATLAVPGPFILYKYGPTIRKNSKFAAAETGASGGDEEKAAAGGAHDDEDDDEATDGGHTDADEVDDDDARALRALEDEAAGTTAVNSAAMSPSGKRKTLAV